MVEKYPTLTDVHRAPHLTSQRISPYQAFHFEHSSSIFLIGQYSFKANKRPPETHCMLTAQPPRDKPYRALLSDQIKHNPSTCPSPHHRYHIYQSNDSTQETKTLRVSVLVTASLPNLNNWPHCFRPFSTIQFSRPRDSQLTQVKSRTLIVSIQRQQLEPTNSNKQKSQTWHLHEST